MKVDSYVINYSVADKIRTVATVVLAVSILALGIIGALAGLHLLPTNENIVLFLQHHTVEVLSSSVGAAGLSLGLASYTDLERRKLLHTFGTETKESATFDQKMRFQVAARFGLGVVLALATALIGIEVFHQNVEMFALLGGATLLLAPVGVRGITEGMIAARNTFRKSFQSSVEEDPSISSPGKDSQQKTARWGRWPKFPKS